MNKEEIYIVQKNDTLWGISKKYYGVGGLYYVIAKANNIKNPDKIRKGKKLLIPIVEVHETVGDSNE